MNRLLGGGGLGLIAMLLMAAKPSPPIAPTTSVLAYEYPQSSPRLPGIAGDPEAVGECRVVVDGTKANGCDWRCVTPDGGSLGTVTDPHTATCVDSFIPGQKAYDITSPSMAPSIVSPAIDAIYGQVASTTVMIALPRSAGRVNGNNFLLDGWKGTGSDGYMQMGSQASGSSFGPSPGFYCSTQYPAQGPFNTSGAVDGWSVVGCRYDGVNSCGNNTHATVDVGLVSTPGCSGARNAMTAGTRYYFGASSAHNGPQTVGADHVNGLLMGWWGWGTRKTDNWWLSMVHSAWGTYSGAGVLTPVASATVQGYAIDNSRTTGNIDVMWTPAVMVNGGGIPITERAHTNFWAADALDLASAIDIGTPDVTNNVMRGPYATFKGGPECDEMSDNDVGVAEGKASLNGWPFAITPRWVNASFILAAGTSGTTRNEATIDFSVTGGTLTGSPCVVTNLTSTPTRYSCLALVSGSPTVVRANIKVGANAGRTGSVIVCHGQPTEGAELFSPWHTNVARPDRYYTLTPTTDYWPSVVRGGKYEILHTAAFDPLTQWLSAFNTPSINNGTDYLFDASIGIIEHTHTMIFGYDGPGQGYFPFRQGVLGTGIDIRVPGIGLTVGTVYATALEWRPIALTGRCRLYVYHNACSAPSIPTSTAGWASYLATWATYRTRCTARTLIGSDVTGTALCPGQPNIVHLGSRMTDSGEGVVPTTAGINGFRILP